MQMQFTGLVTIVTLNMAVSARPVVMNHSSAELVRSDDPGHPGTCEDIELCLAGRDNGVIELHDPQSNGTYNGPI
ncbi:hypothetical protein B0H19DRAFT_1272262 [Mycena capillaripes]|nr:hypothetical protein B0H19DRAFT_1272262 [Mycena capillaripes]